MSVSVFAPAKINLTLEVGRPRADGYHPLQSIVMFADVGDVVAAAPAETLSLSVGGEFGADLDAGENNLVMRAARALAEAANIAQPGAALTLEKSLPVASGIGGGSADAAATLRALNELWKLDWPLVRLQPIARALGADVPVCLAGAPAYMTGVGETFAPFAAPSLSAVLINPLQPLATSDVYRRFDSMGLGAAFAPKPAPDWRDAAAAFAGVAAIGNNLLTPAKVLVPAVDAIARGLADDARVRQAGMSGSGATLFALTANAEDASALADDLQTRHRNWWVADTLLSGA
jgi:4-diphosphocytidyl-2-C-methyl-D-erythritol kinase